MSYRPPAGTQRTPRQQLYVNCGFCGTTFAAYRKSAQYCSRRCKQLGAARRREPRQCAHCGEAFHPLKRTSRFCSPGCARFGVARETAEQRGNTMRGTGTGATYVKRENRHEHRLVAERMLGRPLRADEVVHHINGDGRDNRPDNLQVMPRAEHSRLHSLEMWAERKGVAA